MSERVPRINEGTRFVQDAVTLFVGKAIYEGWEDVKITRELNSVASDFQLQITDKWRADKEPWVLTPGETVHIHMGNQSVLTGYIDKIETSVSAGSRRIVITGRSKTADLVDCSIENTAQFTAGLPINELAKKVCEPFGVSVVMLGSAGEAVQNVATQTGETAFAFLDRLARERKLLMYPSYEGNLVFANKGIVRNSTELRQGINILSGNSTLDNSNRFSKYIAKGMGLGFLGGAEDAAASEGEATDAGINRYRPHVLVSENPSDNGSSADRAAYEANIRAAKALTANIQVQGWFSADGKLWEINQLVFVDAGFLGLRRRMLIQKVEFQKNNSGTTTTLSLVREDAFEFSKVVKKEDPLGWLK